MVVYNLSGPLQIYQYELRPTFVKMKVQDFGQVHPDYVPGFVAMDRSQITGTMSETIRETIRGLFSSYGIFYRSVMAAAGGNDFQLFSQSQQIDIGVVRHLGSIDDFASHGIDREVGLKAITVHRARCIRYRPTGGAR